VKRFISAIVLAFVFLASASAPASADPVRHFPTFTIACGGDMWVIVSKPGSSNVVSVNAMPSNSISILMGFTIREAGVIVAEMHKPYALNHGDRIVYCQDLSVPAGVTFTAEVKFTPGP
jgi:hypothetical protein